jgi:two-component system CheB/CheR fusion protein
MKKSNSRRTSGGKGKKPETRRRSIPRAPTPTIGGSRQPAGRRSFPIVGIGASAGGLEALEQFFKHVPERSGMAFVVVQHLDPTRKGTMAELLQRVAMMPVAQAKDRQRVEPDHAYVIPPNKDMSLLHGTLHLMPQVVPRGLNLPIDFFFRSLAEDQQERSLGVVLSGMGSDGTLGLRAIKEKAGATFVQAPSSAKFDSMPRSAIDAGLADVIAPATELPDRILTYRQHAPRLARTDGLSEDKQQSAVEKIFILLRSHTGNDFSHYKRSTVYRRIERRMGLHQIDKIASYVRYLRKNPQETELLFKELLIGVTSFFRDPSAWEHLLRAVLPDLVEVRAKGGVLRAWVPGCSTGEEAYSLAIILREAIEKARPKRNVRLLLFATDLDKEAIERARQGRYHANIAADVSPERLHRFFKQDAHGFRVCKEIRDSVVFAPQNLVMDPPFTKLDILSCRNLLIYLSSELQKKLIPLFHYSLNPGGILLLGSAETVGTFTNLFGTLDGKSRAYRRLDAAMGIQAVDFPSSSASATADAAGGPSARANNAVRRWAHPSSLQALADRLIIQNFSPATVLTDDKGDILYISGRTGKYLEPAVGKANLNVFAMARDGLRFELSGAFSTALREQRPASVRGIRVGTNGDSQMVDLTVQRLAEPEELRGTVMIVLADATMPSGAHAPDKVRRGPVHARLAMMERALQKAREDIQTAREEMQTSQEELKSSNEELQSTNEELQSSNEELTTSKEETQSMNEELQTVNQELQAKVDELSRSSSDMKNLLDSTDIATLFLDSDLRVRRFTTQTTKLIKLIATDAGRPITDIVSDFDYPDLAKDARAVLRTLVLHEKYVATRDGRWFLVRIMPYRTLDNIIDGLVITFTDATSAKLLESTLREQASQLSQITDALPGFAWCARPDGACDFLSQQWVAYAGAPAQAQIAHGWLDQLHSDDRRRVRTEWKAAVDAEAPLDTELRIRSKTGAFRWFKARAVPIRDVQGVLVKWFGTATAIDDAKRGVASE